MTAYKDVAEKIVKEHRHSYQLDMHIAHGIADAIIDELEQCECCCDIMVGDCTGCKRIAELRKMAKGRRDGS